MDFHEFPFDTQNLTIQVQNRQLPSSKIVYSLDRSVREQTQDERLMSGVDSNASVGNIPNWMPIEINFYQQTIGSTSALGDPTAAISEQGVEYSVLTTDLGIRRDVRSFLIKNLLPLALLVIVTYVSLFFSHSQTGARVSFGVTGILTAAVLLSEVTDSLPDVGYNVAIDWAFYAFIALCAGCILVGLLGDYYFENRQLGALRHLDIVARTIYLAIVLGVIAAYWMNFS
jgi:branched-chain amino acid transport system substrate-binding protein